MERTNQRLFQPKGLMQIKLQQTWTHVTKQYNKSRSAYPASSKSRERLFMIPIRGQPEQTTSAAALLSGRRRLQQI